MDESTPAESHSTRLATAVWLTAAAAVALSFFAIAPAGYDMFRLPKELFYRAGAIVSGALLVILAIWQGDVLRRTFALTAPVGIWMVAVAGWTLVTTLTSTNRTVSWFSFAWTIASLVLFLALLIVPRRDSLATLAILLVPALIHAGMLFAQKLAGWNPFRFDAAIPKKLWLTAFLGNPNDVGTFFFFPALAAACAALVLRGAWRYLLTVIAAISLVAIVVAETRSAVAAAAAAALALLWQLGYRRLVGYGVPAAAIAGTALILLFSQNRSVIYEDATRLAWKVDALTSGRLLPALAAAEMAVDRPLLGVGPGAYGFQYMTFKFRVQHKYPALAAPSTSHFLNFGEVHNDHLEVLAETGIIGYALFAGALVLLVFCARGPVDPEGDDVKRRFVRLFAPPLAIGFAVLALAQFPLQIAATSAAAIFCAATCLRWKERA